MLELPVLGLLKDKEMHGYELQLLPVTHPGVEQKATWLPRLTSGEALAGFDAALIRSGTLDRFSRTSCSQSGISSFSDGRRSRGEEFPKMRSGSGG